MKFTHLLVAVALLFLGAAPLQNAHAQEKTTITISGSDTMNLLTQRLAEEYMKTHPNVEISVRGGGSGVGIRDLMDGLNDIAQASRKMKPEEIEAARDNGFNPTEHVVALDGLAIAVNASNPVSELSTGQIRAIYTGAVTKWNQFNPEWPDEPIVLFSRESNCGTYDYFKEHVMQGADFAPNTSYLAATAAVANSVAREKNAIGFGGISYFVRPEGLKVLSVTEKKGEKAVSPVAGDGHVDLKAIQTGTYPVSRPLQYYTPDEPTGEVKAFLDFVKSAEGQAIVEKMEYIPLGESKG